MKYRIDVFENKTLTESIPIMNKEILDLIIDNYRFLEHICSIKIYEIEETLIHEYHPIRKAQ